ncbi:MAG: F0F1 ATP synthase subunit epsilon [Patescibacteria group bacterium]
MKLSVYSLKKVLFQGEAELLNCKTIVGEITVLDNHEPYIGVLTEGVMKVVEKPFGSIQGGEHFFQIKSGFLQVQKNNEVRCIIDYSS